MAARPSLVALVLQLGLAISGPLAAQTIPNSERVPPRAHAAPPPAAAAPAPRSAVPWLAAGGLLALAGLALAAARRKR